MFFIAGKSFVDHAAGLLDMYIQGIRTLLTLSTTECRPSCFETRERQALGRQATWLFPHI